MEGNFFRKHIVIATLISVIGCFFISVIIGQMIGQVVSAKMGLNNQAIAVKYLMESIGKLFAIAVAFVLLLMSGLLRKIKAEGGRLKNVEILLVVVIVIVLYNVIGNGIANRSFAYSEYHPDVLIICAFYAFLTGVLEELVCRVLFFQNMYLKWKNKRYGALQAVFVSSIVFGACHLLNLSAGVAVTLFQVYYAVLVGIIFAAMYLLSKNIWVCIISHFLIDFSSTAGYAFMPNENAMELAGSLSSIDLSAVLIAVFMTIGAVFAIYLLLKQKIDFSAKAENKRGQNVPAKTKKRKFVVAVVLAAVILLLIVGGYVLTAKNTTTLNLPEGQEWTCELEKQDSGIGVTVEETTVTLTYNSFLVKENVLICTNQAGETCRYELKKGAQGLLDAIPQQ